MRKDLINKAYNLYPQYVDGLDISYMNNPQVKVLREVLTTSINNEYHEWKKIISEYRLKNNRMIIDNSNFSISQPSLIMKILLEKNEKVSKVFTLYSSLIIPNYYFIETIIDNSTDLPIKESTINNIGRFEIDVIELINKVESVFKKSMIDKKYLEIKIPNLSFENIKEGEFTIMNAFFNSNKTYL